MLTRSIVALAVVLAWAHPDLARGARDARARGAVRRPALHTTKTDDADLVRAWHAWKAQRHGRYSTVVQRSCECLPQSPTRTDVEGDQVTSVTFDDDDQQLSQHGYEMDELFRLLRGATTTPTACGALPTRCADLDLHRLGRRRGRRGDQPQRQGGRRRQGRALRLRHHAVPPAGRRPAGAQAGLAGVAGERLPARVRHHGAPSSPARRPTRRCARRSTTASCAR